MTPGRQPAAISDAAWDRQVRARLTLLVPELLPGAPAVRHITSWADDVWFVDLSDGGRVVAKHQFYGLATRGTAWDLLQVESDALRHLRACGCPVPVAFGTDPEAQIILLEFAGESTLGDILSSTDDPGPAGAQLYDQLAQRVLRGLCDIDSALAQPVFGAAARVVPGASITELATAWSAVGPVAVAGLNRLWHSTVGQPAPDSVQRAVQALWQRLGKRPPRIGVTDYQPANVVVGADGCRITFLELSKLGWDWTERRAVQYLSSAENKGRSLLSAGVLRAGVLGACPMHADAIDGHHLLFLLLLADRLLQHGHAELTCLKRQLVAPLSDDPDLRELRCTLQPLAEQPCHRSMPT